MVVYKIRNILNNKVYIGYTKQDPIPYIESHFYHALNSIDIHRARLKGRLDFQGKYFYRAIRKYGRDSFEYRILCECYFIEDVKQAERIFIQYYNSTNNQLGYNIAEGGDGGNTRLGMTAEQSEEYNSKISKALRTRLSDPEARKRLSDNQKLNWEKSSYRTKQKDSLKIKIQNWRNNRNEQLLEDPSLLDKWCASKKTSEFREKKRVQQIKFWENPVNKTKMSNKFKESHNTTEVKEKHSNKTKSQWQDPRFAEIMKQRNERSIVALRSKYDSLLEHKYGLLEHKELRKILDCSSHMIKRAIPELIDLGKISKCDDLYLVI